LVKLASAQSKPWSIAVAGGYVYWTNLWAGIARVSTEGGAPGPLNTYGYPQNLSVVGSFVYYTHNASGGSVRRSPVNGNAESGLASPFEYPGAITTAGNFVYFGDTNNGAGGAVRRVAITGGSASLVDSGYGEPSAIVVSGDFVYYATRSGVIAKAQPTGDLHGALVEDQGDLSAVSQIAVGLDNVLYPLPGAGFVMKVSVEGGDPEPVASGFSEPIAVVLDGQTLYVADRAAGQISKLTLGETESRLLASEQSAPHALAVDATSLYWTNEGGTVMKLTPK
jgi:hypothetical protein